MLSYSDRKYFVYSCPVESAVMTISYLFRISFFFSHTQAFPCHPFNTYTSKLKQARNTFAHLSRFPPSYSCYLSFPLLILSS